MSKYLLFLIYPLILIGYGLIIYKKYKDTILHNIKPLIINTTIISIVICGGLYIFFSFENTIYAYDYAGHWIRSLEIKELFINNPGKILPLVYDSMNNMDYSYLPALFNFPLLLIKDGYRWFAITNYVLFLLPSIVLLQILYFNKTKLNKYLPILLIVLFYPLYLTLFYGKVDVCGLFFILICYTLIIFQKSENITYIDSLLINLFIFLSIFLRRWYLYTTICFYLAYLIKILLSKGKKEDYYKFCLSFVIVLIICVLFFRGFILNALTNNYSEAYQFYNRDNKLLSFINYLSPILLIVCIFGLIEEFVNNRQLLIINFISIIVPCILIWRIQSFEYHHYYVFLINIIILFIHGLSFLFNKNMIVSWVAIILLIVQATCIFLSPQGNFLFFTNIKKQPEILENKEQLIDIANYIKSIEPDDNTTAFIAGGSYGIITDDLLRNAFLPDLDGPNIDSSVFDIRDGFPKDIQFIKYIILIEPSLYMDKDYQHMYDVIKEGLLNNQDISSLYSHIKTMPINDKYDALIYERIGKLTPKSKQFFYNQMIKYYPDKTDFFGYILN